MPGRRFFVSLNRPRGWPFDRMRIRDPLNAYMTCCFASAGAGTTGALAGLLLRGTPYDGRLLVLALEITLLIVVAAAIAAAPFVPLATWVGQRWRTENAFYYGGLGGLSAGFAAFLLVGVPDPPGPFGPTEIMIVAAAPLYGTLWGLAWWYLHRRWKSEA